MALMVTTQYRPRNLEAIGVLGSSLVCVLLQELAAEGYRRMSSTSGEGLGLLLWALSQYGWTSDSKRFWNTVFRCVRLAHQQQLVRIAHLEGPCFGVTSALRDSNPGARQCQS